MGIELLKAVYVLINFATMRPLYLVLRIFVGWTVKLFYRDIKVLNKPKNFFNPTIFVSNHSAAFMDPLVIATFNRAIVFFMTRSDVFTKKTRPWLHGMHMLPIYRQQDGVDTKEKNKEVFEACTKVLHSKRSPLIFAEGFTDDVFVRRLKPLKKGAVRMGFGALEACDWKNEINIAAVGVNYSAPNRMQSDILFSNSEKIRLNDFREDYELNPDKVVSELTERIEAMLQNQLTHIENEDWCVFHEDIMALTGKGMFPTIEHHDLPLEQRWIYSKNLADWLNQFEKDLPEDIAHLKADLRDFRLSIAKENLKMDHLLTLKWSFFDFAWRTLYCIVLAPFSLLAMLHVLPMKQLVKNWVEKKMKRPVFWGSTKAVVGLFLVAFFNILLLSILSILFDIPVIFTIIYLFSIGFFYQSYLNCRDKLNLMYVSLWKRKLLREKNVERDELMKRISKLIKLKEHGNH
jgi:hypothetical protein